MMSWISLKYIYMCAKRRERKIYSNFNTSLNVAFYNFFLIFILRSVYGVLGKLFLKKYNGWNYKKRITIIATIYLAPKTCEALF